MSKEEVGKLSVFLGVFTLGVILGFILSFFGALVVVGPEHAPDRSGLDERPATMGMPADQSNENEMVVEQEASDEQKSGYQKPAGWKTYTDETVGIMIDYPPGTGTGVNEFVVDVGGGLSGNAQSSIWFQGVSYHGSDISNQFPIAGIRLLDKLGYSVEEDFHREGNFHKREYVQYGIEMKYYEDYSYFQKQALAQGEELASGCSNYLIKLDGHWYKFTTHECLGWDAMDLVAASIRPIDTK